MRSPNTFYERQRLSSRRFIVFVCPGGSWLWHRMG
jgi:hypothetical protein